MNQFDLIVIGGGAGAFAAAIRANELKAKTALINAGLPLGGTCVNVGCVPSKTLLYAGEILHHARHHNIPGVELKVKSFDFSKVVQDELSLVEKLRQEKYEKVLKNLEYVTAIEGKAKFVSQNEVEVHPVRNSEGSQRKISNGVNTKSEYELRREKKLKEQRQTQRIRMLKKVSKLALIIFVIVGGIGALVWWGVSQPQTPASEIIARGGIHWHPELSIYIKGQKQEISANVGIGISHAPTHTHDTTGTIHLEFSGLVRKDDTRLGRFFEVWGKQFNSNCIFDSCNGTDGQVKMLVNGRENTEFENYPMQDKDKIEIRFE